MPFLVTDGEFTALLGMFGAGFVALSGAVAVVYRDQRQDRAQAQVNVERIIASSFAAAEAIKDSNRILERLAKAQERANALQAGRNAS